jgi:hypothetical protein
MNIFGNEGTQGNKVSPMNLRGNLVLLDVTKYFFEHFFPSMEKIMYVNPNISYANNTYYYNILLSGDMRSGKSTMANAIAAYAINKYGEENVNAIYDNKGSLENILVNGLQDKPVNVLFCDNATMVKQDKDVLRQYFTMRDIYRENFGKSNGLIINMLSLHRYHGVPIELRSNVDAIIFRDSSLNPYDKNLIKKFIDDFMLEQLLKQLTLEKEDNENLKSFNILVSKTHKGVLVVKPYDKFVFKEPQTLFDRLKDLYDGYIGKEEQSK